MPLSRDLNELAAREHDLVVVGGGVFGCAIAWDAAQRGLSVALLERGDFSAATSANSYKVIHGGIRYVQHGDVVRVRESSRERGILFRIAPHLTQPLPIVIPTYGHGMEGKAILRAGCAIYDALTLDRNRGVTSRAHRIGPVRGLSRDEILREFPGLERDRLTGGVVMHDGQMYNPPRLAFSYVLSAARAGALVANWVEVDGFLKDGDRVTGVTAQDREGGARLEVRGKVVVNATGAWAPGLLAKGIAPRTAPALSFSRDACFVVKRRLTGRRALAVLGRTKDPDAILARSKRHLFLSPWRDYTIVGVWHKVHRGAAGEFTVTERELQAFIDEVNDGYRDALLTLDDVTLWNAGLVLFGENAEGAENLSYGKRSVVVDHARAHGVEGIVTVVGVRYTTSRGIAHRVVDQVYRKLDSSAPACRTATTPLLGGELEDLDEFLAAAERERPADVSAEAWRGVARNYGTLYREVLAVGRDDPSLFEALEGSNVLAAQVVHAARAEMACRLEDIVLRRTDLGTGEAPSEQALRSAADLAARELGWSEARKAAEIESVQSGYARALEV